MKDPLSYLSTIFPYDPEQILATACGDAYVAIMLASGRIGVCSTLGKPVDTDPLSIRTPDLQNPDHRKLCMAYVNAQMNYPEEQMGSGDIFDQVDFTGKANTVMVGYFPPLVEKFRKEQIAVTVFDLLKDLPDLTPLDQLNEKLSLSDCVILTATTLINSSFTGILDPIKPGAEILMLGPSTPLSPAFRDQYHLTALFGMQFKPYDFEVLNIIGKGMGTQSFSKKSKKVSL